MDFSRAGTPIGPSSSRSKLIYHDDMVYEGWIDSKFILVYKSIWVIMQGCTGDSEQGL